LTKLCVIKYFAVENDRAIAVRAMERLIAAFEIDNPQANRSE
jgi:hypothetical protein